MIRMSFLLLAAVSVLFDFGASTATTRPPTAEAHPPILLVVDRAEDLLEVIDPVSRMVVNRIPTGHYPHLVTASDDGRLAFVTNQFEGSISVIDLATQRQLRKVDLGPGSKPHDMIYTDGLLYFTSMGYKLIGCYDVANDQIISRVGIGQAQMVQIALSKDANTMFTSNNYSQTTTALKRVLIHPREGSPYSNWKLTVIPVGKKPHGIDISPDGKEVWIGHYGEGISIIDVATLKVVQVLDIPLIESNSVKFTPDGKRVLVSDVRGGALSVIDAKTRQEIKRIKLGTRSNYIAITPDGSRAYVVQSSVNKVASVDLKTLEVTNHINTGDQPEGIVWVETR
jgi:YVTN family beta-propeller protein